MKRISIRSDMKYFPSMCFTWIRNRKIIRKISSLGDILYILYNFSFVLNVATLSAFFMYSGIVSHN